jgi:hypothetical protein
MDVVPLEMTLLVQGDPDAPPDELDALTRQLLDEVRATDVESAELVSAGPAPAGTKSPEAITLGAVAVAVLPAFVPKLVEFAQAWSLRGQGRAIKFKGKLAGQDVEFEGTAAELKAVLAMLQPPAAPGPAPAAAPKPG